MIVCAADNRSAAPRESKWSDARPNCCRSDSPVCAMTNEYFRSMSICKSEEVRHP